MIDSKIIAHRFGAGDRPESTAAALKNAVAAGVTWVECDASLLGDGNVIVFHDDRFDRCTNKTGRLIDANLDDVKKMDAGSWFDPIYKGERILELKEALSLLESNRLNINLELKVNGDEAQQLVDTVCKIVTQTGYNPQNLLYSSFSHEALQHLRHLDPHARIGCLFECLPKNWLQQARTVQAATIHGSVDHFDEQSIHHVKKAGYPLYLYTVNKTEQAEQLFAQGVDAIFTDFPRLFL